MLGCVTIYTQKVSSCILIPTLHLSAFVFTTLFCYNHIAPNMTIQKWLHNHCHYDWIFHDRPHTWNIVRVWRLQFWDVCCICTAINDYMYRSMIQNYTCENTSAHNTTLGTNKITKLVTSCFTEHFFAALHLIRWYITIISAQNTQWVIDLIRTTHTWRPQ